MTEPVRRRATYEDVLQSPEHVVAEVIEGVLYQSPRPASLHARAATIVGGELVSPFDRGKGGPGGWIILDEPEVHLGPDIVVPDVAGWRRTTLPEIPDAPFFDVRPDWVCEVASPSTRALDRGKKLDVYARAGVARVWLIEPLERFLEVLELDGSSYRIVDHAEGDTPRRLRPFEAIEFDVGAMWAR
jgi:Uma2 family endonuclease